MATNDSPGQQPTSVRYQVLAAACLLGLIGYVHRVGFASATEVKTDLRLSDWDWSLAMTVFLVAYAVFEVPWGQLGDRFGARHQLTLVCLGWSLLTAAVAVVGWLVTSTAFVLLAFPLLLVLRFLFGVFQAGAYPTISRAMTDWMPIRERATGQGFVWMFSRLGGAIAPFLMVWLISSTGSWGLSLALVAVLGLVWCVGFWPWFRNRPEDMAQVNDAERALIAAGRDSRHRQGHGHLPWSQLFRSGNVWALCLMYGFAALSASFFITLLPAYLKDHRGLPAEERQWLSGLPLAFGVVACLGGGLISDWIIRRWGNRKWGRRLTGMVGHACAGLALLASSWVQDTWALAALLSLTFFCNDLAMGPAWASCADIGERHAGTLGGAMNMIGNLGAAIGALITGALLGRVFALELGSAEHLLRGNDLLFVVFACSFWVASLCWLGVDATKPLTASPPP